MFSRWDFHGENSVNSRKCKERRDRRKKFCFLWETFEREWVWNEGRYFDEMIAGGPSIWPSNAIRDLPGSRGSTAPTFLRNNLKLTFFLFPVNCKWGSPCSLEQVLCQWSTILRRFTFLMTVFEMALKCSSFDFF